MTISAGVLFYEKKQDIPQKKSVACIFYLLFYYGRTDRKTRVSDGIPIRLLL